MGSAVNVTPSSYRIEIEYPVIAELPSKGAVQLISTAEGSEIAVDGADGWFGFYAANSDKAKDRAEYPTEFLASTLN